MDKGDEESQGDLIKYLEELSGRSLRTRDDIRRYIAEISARKAEELPAVRRWRLAKNATLLVILVCAYLQYYIMGALTEVMSIRRVTFFTPPRPPHVTTSQNDPNSVANTASAYARIDCASVAKT